MNPKVDEFLSNTKNWQAELTALRGILLDCGLVEELKWRQPCYIFNKTNLFILGGFKEYCILSFFNGALLSDTHKLLYQQGENTQAARVMKFKDVKEIVKLEMSIKAYIFEAIELEKAGLKVVYKKNTDLILCDELQAELDKNAALKSAFMALTPGRQRAYNLFVSAAKQTATRTSRVKQHEQRILNGKGINDCVCGKSKRMPNCDGSHKYL